MGDEIVDATLLGLGFAWREGPVVDCDEAAKRAVVGFDYVLFPEVTAGADGALFGDVEEVRALLASGDFIGGHLFDDAVLLGRRCGGQQCEGKGDSSPLRAKTRAGRLRDREM